MPSSAVTPVPSLTTSPAAAVDTDVLFVPVYEGEDAARLVDGLPESVATALTRAVESKEFQGKPYEIFTVPLGAATWKPARVAAIGCGRPEDASLERLRRVASAAALASRQRRFTRIAVINRGVDKATDSAQAITEGLVLANYSGDRYKSGDRSGPPAEQVQIVEPRGGQEVPALERAVERGRILAESCNLARDLCNEPSNVLTPSVFADRAVTIARGVGLGAQILDEDELVRLRMGLLLGVGRGSAEPPRMIVLRHEPVGAPAAPVLGLVGKGITFDTGGISIKPADGMEKMKDDMAGGAAVVCAMRAIALLKAPIRVIGLVPSAENMPGGRAIKPGDVLTGGGGKTVEVINTDAEGRLILGDGLWYAQQLGATHLVDVATLTGACVIALGRAASGLFGQPDAWVDVVQSTGARAGDRLWPMPLFEEYADQLRSEIADMMNTGGRPAGACTAAMFLKEFAGGLPWAHLDVAGTAWTDETKPWQAKGPTGVAVRTLAELPFSHAEWQ
jgi:leucyl aminopeptidase